MHEACWEDSVGKIKCAVLCVQLRCQGWSLRVSGFQRHISIFLRWARCVPRTRVATSHVPHRELLRHHSSPPPPDHDLSQRNFPFPIVWVHPALHLRLHQSSAFTHARAQTRLVPTSTPNQALPIRCPTSTSPPLPPFEDDGCEKNSCRRTTPPTSPPPRSDFITYAHCDDRIPC